MADDKEKMKVIFAPEFFEDFEGTQEELDELVKEIMEEVENGTFFENLHPLEDLEEDEVNDPEGMPSLIAKDAYIMADAMLKARTQ